MKQPDNHIDEEWRSKVFVPVEATYLRMLELGALPSVLYQHAEKYHSPETAKEANDMIDSSIKLAKLIEDFYRNKILEARAEGHHSGRYELTKELIPELEKNLTSFTAQLNKGDK